MNNILDSKNYDVISQITSILERAITEEESNANEKVMTEIRALLDAPQSVHVDTHGLTIHGLDEAAQATSEAAQQGFLRQWCNIYYDRDTQKVTTEICLYGDKPSVISQLSPTCPYVCTSIKPMSKQEIADNVIAMVSRNIELALVAAKYNIAEAFQEALMVLSRWEAFNS